MSEARQADEPESVLTVQVLEADADLFVRNAARLVFLRTWFAERGPGRVYERAWWITVPRTALSDSEFSADQFAAMADRGLRPWAYPDVPSFPPLVLFPALDRLERWWLHARVMWATRLRRRLMYRHIKAVA